MVIQVEFWHLVELLLGFIGVLGAFAKLMINKMDERISQQTAQHLSLEKEFLEHKAKLPLEYQRREDAIRFETVLNAKLDTIYNTMERIRESKQ